jgi:NADPH-dependent ferric siderophore reductase
VVSVAPLTPRLVSVVVGGPGLAGFTVPAPTAHIKVFLPAPGEQAPALPVFGPDGPEWPDGAARPVVRTYTPRRFDEEAGTLEVQFVVHGTGPASDWAQRVKVGDQLGVAGPGGRFSLDPTVERWWIAGDESAVPAMATLLEALPTSAAAEVHVEVEGPEDELALASPAQIDITWHHRSQPDGWGADLYDAATHSEVSADTRVWAAYEAVAVRRLRTYLLKERHLPVSSIVTRGYWRLGTANHPDHDYGED